MAVTKLTQKRDPTNLDLQRQAGEMHRCLDQVGQDVAAVKVDVADVKGDIAAVKTDVGAVKTDVDAAKGAINRVETTSTLHTTHIEQLAGALGVTLLTAAEIKDGVTPEKSKHRLGNIRPSHAFWMMGATMVAGIPGGISAYKIVEPVAVAAAAALHHALMTAH